MGPIDATLRCLARPFTWSGRAAPSEYWWFTLVHFLVGTALTAGILWPLLIWLWDQSQGRVGLSQTELAYALAARSDMATWVSVLNIWPSLCGIAVLVRRLHDTDRSGWWYWIALIPFVGWLILLFLLILPGDASRNDYGNPPGGGRAPGEIGRMAPAAARDRPPLDPTIPAPVPMGPMASTLRCLGTPFTWRGRAGPGEFWWFTLFYYVLSLAAAWYLLLPVMQQIDLWEAAVAVEHQRAYNTFTDAVPPPFPDLRPAFMENWIGWSIYLLLSIPLGFSWLAVCVRRLHDTDHSGAFYWLILVPFLGLAFLVLLLATPGQIQRNRYGPGHGVPVERASRNNDMPIVPRSPVEHVSGADALRALRASRMPST